jgi:hypothetical protein
MSKPTISVAAAKVAMADYIKQKNAKAKIDKKQKEAAACLAVFAAQHRDKFKDGNYKLPGGYLHFGDETLIVPCDGFDLAAFVNAFPELVALYKEVKLDTESINTLDKTKVKTSAIKALLDSPEGKGKLTAQHCVEIKQAESFSIVVK